PEPYLRNFSIYLAEKKYDKAEELLREALRNGISDAVIYASLGYLATQEKDHKKAIDYYEVAAEKDPENYSYKFYLAVATDQAGKRKEAIKVLEKSVSEGADLPEIYNYLGYLYVEEGQDLDKAISLIKKSIAKDPDNGAYIDSLGWAYYKKGMLPEAVVEIERAAHFLPEDPVVRDHLGEVYYTMGEWEKALVQWKLSFKLYPANIKILNKIRAVERKIKNGK
ncbi:MAG: tetratricopeptide repeat protein, partial [Candidatus Omnitrophota bacterium]